jgi:hypothetical protein
MKQFIVKVQLPLATNAPEALALVYDKTKSFYDQVEITEELKEQMLDLPKAFFFAKMINEEIFLTGRAPWQKW